MVLVYDIKKKLHGGLEIKFNFSNYSILSFIFEKQFKKQFQYFTSLTQLLLRASVENSCKEPGYRKRPKRCFVSTDTVCTCIRNNTLPIP